MVNYHRQGVLESLVGGNGSPPRLSEDIADETAIYRWQGSLVLVQVSYRSLGVMRG